MTTFLRPTYRSLPFRHPRPNPVVKKVLCMASTPVFPRPSSGAQRPLVVVGSVNADIYVEIRRLPLPGETLAANTGYTLPGGKGANQAACAAKLGYPTYFIGQVGEDGQAGMLREALSTCGVRLDHMATVPGPTGQAVVMLQPGGQNSIVIVGGANVAWPSHEKGMTQLTQGVQQLLKGAGAVLLQREVPDDVNKEVAKIARDAGVPVILDAGGAEGPLDPDILDAIAVLSPNETELSRLTQMITDDESSVLAAAEKLQEAHPGLQVLVKLGELGSLLVQQGREPIRQPVVPAPVVVDTTGAGDTFTAAYVVGLLEGKPPEEALKFAASAASLCVRKKGAMPSMPDRGAMEQCLRAEAGAQ